MDTRNSSSSNDFLVRHIGTPPWWRSSDDDLLHVLGVIGVASVDELIDATVPESIRLREPLDLPEALDEVGVLDELRTIAARNVPRTNLLGMGYTRTITPPVIRRNVLENPAWYTAYTPYQPEISQGRLEALLNFQTLVADLTGLPIANASLLDEATAAAEAMSMARRIGRNDGSVFFVDADVHPQMLSVITTRAEPVGIRVVVGDVDEFDGRDCFGALMANPTSTGRVVDRSSVITRLSALGIVCVVAVDPLASVLVTSAGAMGADIAVGSAQRFGVPLGFGGPHAAFIATREEHARSLPGRLVGVSTDSGGRPALRLALQTREQHIRREKATSNICTAQALLANIAGFYAVWHGPDGLRRIAERVGSITTAFAVAMQESGHRLRHDTWFDTVAVEVDDAEFTVDAARRSGIGLRLVDVRTVSITFDEVSTLAEAERVAAILGARSVSPVGDRLGVPDGLIRHDEILSAKVFHAHRTEHGMLRYLRRLADKDLALDRTMIPLGSCTMKLNATTEMEPITWPSFADVHPFAPDDETVGYRDMISELEQMLAEITGYDAVSLQPNAGSQGELAGLLAIRRFHASRNEQFRDVCLIPSSAHGTNAASAVMAGMRVVVVGCDDEGNVDLDDLQRKINGHSGRVAAAMVTYPSTHGVFEESIVKLCDMVHGAGGQVYVDGANLNALVGLARPGRFGADVSHLNLHKTFCIPHGGGGPGVGPVAVRSHLAPFLPGDPLERESGAVSAARFGSAGILPIPWTYIRLMGAHGLRAATVSAIVNANYVAKRLGNHYPVLFTGPRGFVAHECIIDIRPLTKSTGVTVDDIAKRLMDHGFHAPTVSFPVAGTLMIEPTESESTSELDRFCDAMVAIRVEIDDVASGRLAIDESPLRHAPHTMADLVGEWGRAYPRFAGRPDPESAYVVPVGRIDAAYGDRNLVCTCEPLEAYAESAVG